MKHSSWQANGAGADTEVAFGFVCFCPPSPCLCEQVYRAAPVMDQTSCLESQLLAWLWHKDLCCSHRNLLLNESIIPGKPKIRWIKHSLCSYPHEGVCKGIWFLLMLSMPLAPGTGHHHQAQIRGIASIDCYQVWIRAAMYTHTRSFSVEILGGVTH